jgi:hypothetical protein
MAQLYINSFLCYSVLTSGARGSWLRGYATSRKVAGSSPNEVTGFFQLTTQPLTEMCTWNILGGKRWPARRAQNLAAIYEPIV